VDNEWCRFENVASVEKVKEQSKDNNNNSTDKIESVAETTGTIVNIIDKQYFCKLKNSETNSGKSKFR